MVSAKNLKWEEVIDFSKIKKGGIDVSELLKRLQSPERRTSKTYKK